MTTEKLPPGLKRCNNCQAITRGNRTKVCKTCNHAFPIKSKSKRRVGNSAASIAKVFAPALVSRSKMIKGLQAEIAEMMRSIADKQLEIVNLMFD